MTAAGEPAGPIYGPTPPTMRDLRYAVIREMAPPEEKAWRRRDDLQRADERERE